MNWALKIERDFGKESQKDGTADGGAREESTRAGIGLTSGQEKSEDKCLW